MATKIWENGKWTTVTEAPTLSDAKPISRNPTWEELKEAKRARIMGGCSETKSGEHMVGSDEHCEFCGQHVNISDL